MKRYLLFFSFAFVIHALIFLPLLWKQLHKQNDPGGGAGGTIQISVEPAPEPTQASKAQQKRASQQQRTQQAGYDAKTGTNSGQSFGRSAGPRQGEGSGTVGNNIVLAEIRRRIEAAKRYPMMARKRGVTGVASVSFKITPRGSITSLQLAQSSGATVLDRAALDTVRRAAPFPFYPQPIQIGIRFTLNKKSGG